MTDAVVGDEVDDLDDPDEDDADEVDADELDGNRIEAGTAQDLLEFLATSIVEDPEAVVVEPVEHRGSTTLRLRVSPSDMGRVIGRRGRVAQAIRTVVRAAGARDNVDVSVDIVD